LLAQTAHGTRAFADYHGSKCNISLFSRMCAPFKSVYNGHRFLEAALDLSQAVAQVSRIFVVRMQYLWRCCLATLGYKCALDLMRSAIRATGLAAITSNLPLVAKIAGLETRSGNQLE
jgi:hypothetical protein